MSSSCFGSTGLLSKFQTPACTLIPISSLTAVPDGVSRLNIGSLVDCPPVDFDPGVGLEREFLRTQDHVRRNPFPPEQIGGHESALQTKNLFWVPDAGIVDRRADTVDGVIFRTLARHGPTRDHLVDAPESRESVQ